MNVLVIDCYDSFTYNLCQQIGKTGCNLTVFKNDADPEEVFAGNYDRIILSPGPGKPENSGLCLGVLETLSRETPTLGVCLGHQAICHFFGAEVVKTNKPVHGKVSEIIHDGGSIYSGLKSPITATRYHSLAVLAETLPGELVLTAKSTDDGMIMGVRHTKYPVEGVQFHPESILTGVGDRLMENFLKEGICR
jgi:anthranilate synthase component II